MQSLFSRNPKTIEVSCFNYRNYLIFSGIPNAQFYQINIKFNDGNLYNFSNFMQLCLIFKFGMFWYEMLFRKEMVHVSFSSWYQTDWHCLTTQTCAKPVVQEKIAVQLRSKTFVFRLQTFVAKTRLRTHCSFLIVITKLNLVSFGNTFLRWHWCYANVNGNFLPLWNV